MFLLLFVPIVLLAQIHYKLSNDQRKLSLWQNFQFCPKAFFQFLSPCTNFTVDKSVPISINSNPDPTVVFFEPIYVCISSNSTTSISPVRLRLICLSQLYSCRLQPANVIKLFQFARVKSNSP